MNELLCLLDHNGHKILIYADDCEGTHVAGPESHNKIDRGVGDQLSSIHREYQTRGPLKILGEEIQYNCLWRLNIWG